MGRAFRAALALFLCLASGASLAAGTPANAMPVGKATTTPIGWIMFCREFAPDCAARPAEGSSPRSATPAFMAAVDAVNRKVNRAVQPVTDRELYGVEERWTYPKDKGDCEDFALEKRKELHAAGVPIADLLMTVVHKRNGEGHAILTVRTTSGDYVLDNLDPDVRLWSDTSYTYVKRQSTADPNVWLAIVNDADVAVGAVKQ
ncbi:transglutaminase [Aureimonas endophytica]|uniref:Transglutaminase n=1 Tax=Aureimonas endophytica TaxID=2027858 RepID=A0A916ZH55_9HYPH|nr:transglutaminase-like cysteine peptidase [Aureimonas endophytica]GGD96148.1 transglutaminase [Aureimonas endophytica]